jgi:hypothetical protein
MKIPIQLSFKLFNETTTIKTTVDDLHVAKTMDMYKNLMVPLFGEESYENTILSMAEGIKRRRKKEPTLLKVYRWLKDIFKD